MRRVFSVCGIADFVRGAINDAKVRVGSLEALVPRRGLRRLLGLGEGTAVGEGSVGNGRGQALLPVGADAVGGEPAGHGGGGL